MPESSPPQAVEQPDAPRQPTPAEQLEPGPPKEAAAAAAAAVAEAVRENHSEQLQALEAELAAFEHDVLQRIEADIARARAKPSGPASRSRTALDTGDGLLRDGATVEMTVSSTATVDRCRTCARRST